MDNCLSDLIDQSCQSSVGQRLSITEMKRINNFQTQFISNEIQKFDDPSIGHQYVCCYDDKSSVTLAKGLTAIARERFNSSYLICLLFFLLKSILDNREMFSVTKPEFSLVTEDTLKYQCVGHELIYDDLRMIYNDGYTTYERDRFDAEWTVVGTSQGRQVDLDWLSPPRLLFNFEFIRKIQFLFRILQ